jgi:hypothetical protein
MQFTSEIDHFCAPYLLLHRSSEFVIENGDFFNMKNWNPHNGYTVSCAIIQ